METARLARKQYLTVKNARKKSVRYFESKILLSENEKELNLLNLTKQIIVKILNDNSPSLPIFSPTAEIPEIKINSIDNTAAFVVKQKEIIRIKSEVITYFYEAIFGILIKTDRIFGHLLDLVKYPLGSIQEEQCLMLEELQSTLVRYSVYYKTPKTEKRIQRQKDLNKLQLKAELY